MNERDDEMAHDDSLAALLRERIRRDGPITFRDWMAAALYDERHGYYCRNDLVPWGRKGDYRTAPERSTVFAATFARYFADLYEKLGSPPSFTILESGPGSGHFAFGVFMTFWSYFQDAFLAVRYVVDEASDSSRTRLREFLKPFEKRVEFTRLADIEKPFEFGIIFSNELLDAMPAHRVVRNNFGIQELFVGLEGDRFVWTHQEPSDERLEKYFSDADIRLEEGQLAEVNLDAGDWIRRASKAIVQGYVVTVDYGAEAADLYDPALRMEGSLRAYRRHQIVDSVLEEPGSNDITTTVDWTNVKRVGEQCGLETVSLEPLGEFLLRAEIIEQMERMAGGADSETDALIMRTSARDLILPGGMQESFQVLVQRKVR